MNRTLFDCGVRKSVELKNGSLLDITSTMKKTAILTKSYDVQCSCCGKAFNGQQYLDSHMKFKHPSSTAENSHEGQQHRDISANLIKRKQMFLAQCLMIAHQKLLMILLLLTKKVLERSEGVVRSANPTQLNSKRKPLIFWIL